MQSKVLLCCYNSFFVKKDFDFEQKFLSQYERDWLILRITSFILRIPSS